ncbi:MAG: hypothetical protein BWY25_01715 [Chloroflexi bacterium ADurb.Bin222]|nr:MAG: hypothetical protein BWY25_01715 [Chloroflexi bacterium ADurb.Bin222]
MQLRDRVCHEEDLECSSAEYSSAEALSTAVLRDIGPQMVGADLCVRPLLSACVFALGEFCHELHGWGN